jgi:two-component system alkaline phosphatase synthesis response regulator PhoP
MNPVKILIVDDEPTVRAVARRMLDKQFVVIEASDGEEAISIARFQKPDLILMDVMMPRMDGNTACSILKSDEVTKLIPVVMLSGVTYELNKKLAAVIGADAYITKPFSSQDLLNTVHRFLKLSQ